MSTLTRPDTPTQSPCGELYFDGAADSVLLTGTIKSASGENLGGVTVSAKLTGHNVTTTVFTDEQGNYYFPAMNAGKYHRYEEQRGNRREKQSTYHRPAERSILLTAVS